MGTRNKYALAVNRVSSWLGRSATQLAEMSHKFLYDGQFTNPLASASWQETLLHVLQAPGSTLPSPGEIPLRHRLGTNDRTSRRSLHKPKVTVWLR